MNATAGAGGGAECNAPPPSPAAVTASNTKDARADGTGDGTRTNRVRLGSRLGCGDVHPVAMEQREHRFTVAPAQFTITFGGKMQMVRAGEAAGRGDDVRGGD